MLIEKNKLEEVKINVMEEEIDKLLTKWCGNNYDIFGNILAALENINDRIILLNYSEKNNNFMTFDANANPLFINLGVNSNNDERTITIDRYGVINEYTCVNSDEYIYINKAKEKLNIFRKRLVRDNN